jgi:hypothetical protein
MVEVRACASGTRKRPHSCPAPQWETEPLCSACDPTVGKWHGEFLREPFEVGHQREIERWLELSWVEHYPDGAAPFQEIAEKMMDANVPLLDRPI